MHCKSLFINFGNWTAVTVKCAILIISSSYLFVYFLLTWYTIARCYKFVVYSTRNSFVPLIFGLTWCVKDTMPKCFLLLQDDISICFVAACRYFMFKLIFIIQIHVYCKLTISFILPYIGSWPAALCRKMQNESHANYLTIALDEFIYHSLSLAGNKNVIWTWHLEGQCKCRAMDNKIHC